MAKTAHALAIPRLRRIRRTSCRAKRPDELTHNGLQIARPVLQISRQILQLCRCMARPGRGLTHAGDIAVDLLRAIGGSKRTGGNLAGGGALLLDGFGDPTRQLPDRRDRIDNRSVGPNRDIGRALNFRHFLGNFRYGLAGRASKGSSLPTQRPQTRDRPRRRARPRSSRSMRGGWSAKQSPR